MFDKIKVPETGEKLSFSDGKLQVPDNPIIPYIEGDGIGVDITPAMINVVDAAMEKAYGGKKKITWMEIYAGEKAVNTYGGETWLPDETLAAIKEFFIGIKGPLTTPVGGGIRSLNVALRQELDLYCCQRPIVWFKGVPSPVRNPQDVDMVIFRENSEDIYAGVEWEANTPEVAKLLKFLREEMGVTKIKQDKDIGIGIKPISAFGTKRLVKMAIEYAIANDRESVTLVHKGNIMKFTEGSFKEWGYELAREEFGATELDGGPWHTLKNPNTGKEIVIKDVIADAFLQLIQLRPKDCDIIATMNLNGDYISDALAAQVGGIGIAPGANIGEQYAIFEATHGTAPKYAGKDMVNPSSLILSAEMMLRHLGWTEAADMIIASMGKTIASKKVTYDFHRLMDGATKLSCSEFGNELVANL